MDLCLEIGQGGKSVNNKIIFSFLFGLFIGFSIGYVITDFHYRKLELKTKSNPTQSTSSPMDEVHRQLKTFQEILKKNPNDYETLVHLGNLYYDIGQYDKAIPYYEKAVEIKKDKNVITDLGTCLRETGNAKDAVKYYEEALKIDASHWRAIYNIIIVSIKDLKDKEKALFYFEKLKKINPPEINLDSLYNEIQKI